jgi:hypothetical protein
MRGLRIMAIGRPREGCWCACDKRKPQSPAIVLPSDNLADGQKQKRVAIVYSHAERILGEWRQLQARAQGIDR